MLSGTTLTWTIVNTVNLYNGATPLQAPLNADAWLAEGCFNYGNSWDVGLMPASAGHQYCGYFAYDESVMTLTVDIPLDANLAQYIRDHDESIFWAVSARASGFVQ